MHVVATLAAVLMLGVMILAYDNKHNGPRPPSVRP